MSRQPFDIVGYTYQADNYCPDDIADIYGVDQRDDVELWLDCLAVEQNIDRYNERSFDSGDFPKVLFRDQARDDERCGACGKALAQ